MNFDRKRLLFITFLALAAVCLLLVTLPTNEGTPSRRDGQNGCGLKEGACHEADQDSTLTLEISARPDDHHFFQAVIYKDGEKVPDADSESQAKAVADDAKGTFYDSMEGEPVNNEDELDITSASPVDGQKFWVGFGYKEKGGAETKHIFELDEIYTYEKENEAPIPVAQVSVDDSFPDGDDTIELETGDDDKTLHTSLTKEGERTIYFKGSDSTDSDGDEMTYYWDIDGDGQYETGEAGEDMDERGETKTFTFTEAGTYDLKFKVADGVAESDSLHFTLDIKDIEKKPELYPEDIQVLNEEGTAETDFVEGDIIELSAFVKNNEGGNYGEDTADVVDVTFYYARDGEGYAWTELYTTTTDNAIADKDQAKITYTWDTTGFEVDSYKVRVTVDKDDKVAEWAEDNNTEDFGSILYIDENPETGTPIVAFIGDIIFNIKTDGDTKIYENTDVEIDVTISNTGDGDAQNVIIIFKIDGVEKTRSQSFTISVGTSQKLSEFTPSNAFLWAPSKAESYEITLEFEFYHGGQKYDDSVKAENVDVAARIVDPGNGGGNGGGGNQVIEEDSGGFLPGFEAFTGLVAIVGVSLLVARKKRF